MRCWTCLTSAKVVPAVMQAPTRRAMGRRSLGMQAVRCADKGVCGVGGGRVPASTFSRSEWSDSVLSFSDIIAESSVCRCCCVYE